jgi:pantoate--beta-alanine ligase
MRDAVAAMRGGADIGETMGRLTRRLLEAGFGAVDYAEVRDAESLAALEALGARPARLLVAARIGRARLIDNCPV